MKLHLYEESLLYINRAIESVDKTKDNHKFLCTAYIQLSALYIEMDQLDNALEIVKELNELVNQVNSNEIKVIAFQHIGTIYFKQGEYEEALFYYLKSYDLVLPSPIEIVHSIIYCFLKLKDYKKHKLCFLPILQ